MYQIMVALLSGLEPTQFGLKLSEFGLLSLAGFTLSLYPSKSFLGLGQLLVQPAQL